jgi:hypothetical protein
MTFRIYLVFVIMTDQMYAEGWKYPVMTSKEEPIHIMIFDESDLLTDETNPGFRTTDFGGIIPQVGDLIALPTVPQDSDSDLHENQRMREVIERYFWPSIDPKIPMRVGLLVRERRARKSPRRSAVTNTKTVTRAGTSPDVPFIIQQIYTCLQAAKECDDAEIEAALRKLAEAFADRAIALGADPKTIPRGTQTSG